MKNINEIIVENLIVLRKKAGLTQIELAKKVNFSDKAISRWENGEVTPDIDTLNTLSEIYNVPIAYFFEKHIEENDEQFSKNQKVRLRNTILLGIISVLVVWTIASIVFVYLQTLQHIVFWQVFVWAVPLSCLTLIFFNNKWIKNKKVSLILQSCFVWSLITCIYLQLLQYNLWLIYIIGAPIQATLIARYYLR